MRNKFISMAIVLTMLLTAVCMPVMGADSVTSVSIEGTAKTAYTLTAKIDGNAASYTYDWQSADTADGAYTSVGKDVSFKVDPELAGKFIKVTVTPDGGTAVTSAPVQIAERYVYGAANSAFPSNQTIDNPNEYLFNLEGSTKKYSLLDTNADGEHFVLTADMYSGNRKYDYSASGGWQRDFRPTVDTNMAYYLNTTLLDTTSEYHLEQAVIDHLATKIWHTEYFTGGKKADYLFEGKVAIPTIGEYIKYSDKFGYGNNGATAWWWLRSAEEANGVNVVAVNGGNPSFELRAGWREDRTVRPCFWLDKAFFMQNRIDLDTAGSAVTEMLSTVYTRNELENAGYTDDQLSELFPSAGEVITGVSVSGEVRPGRTLSAAVETESGNGCSYSCEWFIADTKDGNYTVVSTAKKYTLTNANAQKFIKVKVTSGEDSTNTAESEPVEISKVLKNAGDLVDLGLPEGQQRVDPGAYKFYVTRDGGWDAFNLLDTDSNGNMFILAGNIYGATVNDQFRMDPANEKSVSYYLNTTVLNGGGSKVLLDGIKEHLINYTWLSDVKDGDDYEHTAKLALLSLDEYFKYGDKFGYNMDGGKYWWWIRSFSAGGNRLAVNGDSSKFYTQGSGNVSVRPCFWLDRDFFKQEKIIFDGPAAPGAEVLKAIRKTYSRSEMEATYIYTSDELDIIYNTGETVTATNVKIQGTAAVGQTLRGTYDYNSSTNSPESGSTYAWYISADGTNYTKIDGADAKEYVIKESDAGKTIKFGVIARSDDGGESEEALSVATAMIIGKQEFSVSFKELRGASGSAIDTIAGQSALTAAFTVENYSGAAKDISLVIALFTSSNEMINVNVDTVTAAIGANEYTVGLTGLDVKEGYIVRAMALNDMVNIQPLCGGFEK